mgnify:CR=1 FL=1
MTGLTNEEVQERIAQGQVNNNENPNTRTYKQIILENTLTFFNFLNLVLLVLVLLVGSYKNSMFVGIIFINTVIGIIQEVRAKKTIDKLAILTESKTVVLREGKKWKISTEKLVVDDLIFLKAGEQVPADAKILEGSLEVNESLLTGEADNLPKNPGDELFSGSFVTSLPSIMIFPSSTGHTPAIAFRVVDFPAPFPPMIVTKSPSFKVRFKSFKACFSFTVPLLNVLFT